jgi:hypothetical protein
VEQEEKERKREEAGSKNGIRLAALVNLMNPLTLHENGISLSTCATLAHWDIIADESECGYGTVDTSPTLRQSPSRHPQTMCSVYVEAKNELNCDIYSMVYFIRPRIADLSTRTPTPCRLRGINDPNTHIDVVFPYLIVVS